jgi:branched-chain amino acid transport system ATP-binding protein
VAEALLQLQGLRKRFGGLVASDNVTLDVRSGEIHALIGPNGAGKTTLIAQVAGSLKPDAGRIVFAGQDVTARPVHARVVAGLARSYQITSIFGGLTVLENLGLAAQARSGHSMSFWRPAAAETRLAEEAERVAALVGLDARLEATARTLAHGEQRALEVGLALATRPRLLLLDEPMAGAGPEESARLVELIRRVSREVSVLLVEHDMDAVFRLADRISVLVSGAVVASGTREAIRADPLVRQAYLGDEALA